MVLNTPSHIKDQSIIRDSNNPFNKTGGLKIIEGNIGRGIIKTSSLKSNINHIDGIAIVFDSRV
mgnify:CR=1 FL=1